MYKITVVIALLVGVALASPIPVPANEARGSVDNWKCKSQSAGQCYFAGEFSWQVSPQSNTLYLSDNNCNQIGQISNSKSHSNFPSKLKNMVVVQDLQYPHSSHIGHLQLGFLNHGNQVPIPAYVINDWFEAHHGNCDCYLSGTNGCENDT